jgi:tRNA pseudouridine38-40 synthase
MITRYRATLMYDGGAYNGFQRQAAGIPSVQGEVERALAALTGQQTTVVGAGRTDTGVHAEGQVIAFDVEWKHGDDALLRALNATLAQDVALLELRQQAGFHPRFDALSRTYRYTIVQAAQRQPLLRGQAWHISQPLDHAGMVEAAASILGEHDFAALGKPPQGENTVRTVIRSEWGFVPQTHCLRVVYHIEANAFLQHMVRRLVGLLVEIGRGAMTPTEFTELVAQRDRTKRPLLAPPHGLVLESVRYS